MTNRVQLLVLTFFAVVWIALVIILVQAPEVYDQALKLSDGHRDTGEALFLLTLTTFIALLVIGVVRRWRWTFWLILIAFFAGALRLVASILEVAGVISATGPVWYTLLQGGIGIVQFAIALVMFAGYRRTGLWGEP